MVLLDPSMWKAKAGESPVQGQPGLHTLIFKKIKEKKDQAPVAHAYNPSYSGGRDQEDHSSKPAWANSS
jgi:hypothetical protein